MKEQQKDSDRQCERIVGNPNLRHPTLPLPIGVFLLKKGQGRRCQQIEMPAHRQATPDSAAMGGASAAPPTQARTARRTTRMVRG